MKVKNKVIISLLTSFFVLIIFQIKILATEGTVTEITVNVREKASTDSKKIMYVTQDDKVEVIEKVGDWYKIKAKNKTGFVYSSYIKVDDNKIEYNSKENKNIEETSMEGSNESQEITKDIELKFVIPKGTQVKIVPNISSSVIHTVSKEGSVTIINQIDGWTYVSVEKVLGWIRTDKIKEQSSDYKKEENVTTNQDVKEEKNKIEKGKIAYVKYDTVNMRERASTNAKVLAKLKFNDEVTVLEEVSSVWSKVTIDDKIGYISTDLLADEKQKEINSEKNDEETTSRDGKNIERKAKGTSSKKETTRTTTTKDTKTTSASTSSVAISKKEETASSSKVTGTDIVAYAKKYLGYSYVYGGSSPSTGFDCSGFTSYVYKHFGYTISRSSSGQASNGTKVEKKDLQPGDLVIYKNNSLTAIGHVGIYIGDNKMIHASEPGVGVIITDIDSKAHKYPQRYVMGRRILK